MVYISRTEHFNAAHRLFNPNWSDEKNKEVFGPCANHNWHGHNFELIVTVKGEPNPDTGFVIDLKLLGDIIKREIIDQVDHKNLNEDVDFMKGKLSSTENLAIEIWKQIEIPIKQIGCTLHCIKIKDTEKNFVEYFGQ